jgi:hypothetical protein
MRSEDIFSAARISKLAGTLSCFKPNHVLPVIHHDCWGIIGSTWMPQELSFCVPVLYEGTPDGKYLYLYHLPTMCRSNEKRLKKISDGTDI